MIVCLCNGCETYPSSHASTSGVLCACGSARSSSRALRHRGAEPARSVSPLAEFISLPFAIGCGGRRFACAASRRSSGLGWAVCAAGAARRHVGSTHLSAARSAASTRGSERASTARNNSLLILFAVAAAIALRGVRARARTQRHTQRARKKRSKNRQRHTKRALLVN